MATAQVVKWGNSLAVRIPKAVAEKARMKEGDAVVIEAERGSIELRHVVPVPSLEELVSQITPENRYSEMDWGHDRGREKIEW